MTGQRLNLYVRAADVETWDCARELAWDRRVSLSMLTTTALLDYLAKQLPAWRPAAAAKGGSKHG